ncbi:MAG: hypothetical protein IPG43_04930 [Proteobacteria bacterium]|nr:hypothetical protein [Pseudomonadota bacterium]
MAAVDFYDVGDSLACQRGGARQRDARGRASQYASPRHPDRGRYQDYKTARDEALGQR